jgi:hypothetical protein
LATIFLTQIFVQQANEIGIPWVMGKLGLAVENQKMKHKGEENNFIPASQAEQESKMPAYTSTFDDYNEMAIQFGCKALDYSQY